MPTVKITMRPPGLLSRLWYRRINQTPPALEGSTRPTGHLARLVPYPLRRFHHAYATARGFFWLPCPLCGHEFGGHEAGKTIPDPATGPNRGRGICSRCSRTHPE
ncbi:hypothetical protein SAMN05421505_120136 [Sinosporangium album]|uniref:Uncharacterized protein n=1 Tax=Sinosporangium album TaxID=504805 RepID=A0A1G8EK89_9ACTN|nr:hypothetical protein [Sinosporangium album]SDH70288.1 hypothetical protein SAMN05421505_120136 [Sinosporangium album]